MMGDIDPVEVPAGADVVSIDDVAIGENVGEGAFWAKFAVSLC